MLGREIRTFLLADGTVAGLVGTRVYEDTVPKTGETTGIPAIPYIWLQRTSISHELALNETAGADAFRESFAVECVSSSAAGAQTIGDAVFSRLSDYRGAVGSKTVQLIDVTDYANIYTQEVPAGDIGRFVASLSITVYGAA